MSPLFLEPVFKERIWGGKNLESFNYDIPSEHTGECWGISAHENGSNVIKNGQHKGETLQNVWEKDKKLFGDSQLNKFPLLTKILDAEDELSVQVHPDDDYAKKHENGELGKTECWYIIDCDENAEIIYGHHAKDKDHLRELIETEQWNNLFNRIKVNKGDFFYVPSGTVHAIGKGIRILETQQNSDTTYRIYDFDRTDVDGNKRELHIEKSIDVINFEKQFNAITPEIEKEGNSIKRTFVRNEFFTVQQLEVNDTFHYTKSAPFVLMSVIEGKGQVTIDNSRYSIKKGDHFIITNEDKVIDISGNVNIILSHN